MLVFLAGIIWGTIGPAVQLVHDDSGLSPLATSAYRAIAAVAVLLLASAVTGRLQRTWSLARHHSQRVLVIGLLIAASQLLFFIAVKRLCGPAIPRRATCRSVSAGWT